MTAGEEPQAADETLPELEEAASARSDPFRLRGEPPAVMRLSRKTLAIAGALAGTAIGGALLWALQPADKKAPENLYVAEGANKPDTVTGAPADYGAIPKLGPPLPGDLGRPILSAQQEGQLPPVSLPPTPTGVARDPALDARDRARQEGERERKPALPRGRRGFARAGP